MKLEKKGIETRDVGWLGVLFYSISTLFRSFNAKLNHFDKFQTIQFSISIVFFLFQTIQFKYS